MYSRVFCFHIIWKQTQPFGLISMKKINDVVTFGHFIQSAKPVQDNTNQYFIVEMTVH